MANMTRGDSLRFGCQSIDQSVWSDHDKPISSQNHMLVPARYSEVLCTEGQFTS